MVVTPETLKAIEVAKAAGRPLWRISSTLFFHVESDRILKPLDRFCQKDADDYESKMKRYPPIMTGDQVQMELKSIKLRKEE